MRQRQPPARDTPPVAARYRVRYRKAGRMRFASARDFQRSLERAIRRGGVPIAFSAGFSPHPKISYTNTVATGVASDAEYLELGLIRAVDPDRLLAALRAGLPDGFEVTAVVPAAAPGFADRLEASRWEIVLPDVPLTAAQEAADRFSESTSVTVERLTKRGTAQVDVRAAVSRLEVGPGEETAAGDGPCAILQVVVRHVTPSVRPVDVLAALHGAAGLPQSQATRICRRAQGPLNAEDLSIGDPLEPDWRAASRA